MNVDKRILYSFSVTCFVLLFAGLFVPIMHTKILFATLLLIMAISCHFVLKKRVIANINKNRVLLLMCIMAILFIVLYYTTGIIFGFYKSTDFITLNGLWQNVIPSIVMIFSVEFIRSIFLQQNDKYVNVLAYLIGVVVDLVLFTNLKIFSNFDRFMSIIGPIFLPSLMFNFTYNYTSKNFGVYPNISFRLLYTLFVYFIPIVPALSIVFETIIKFMLPLLMYLFFHFLFDKEKKQALKKKNNTLSKVILSILIVFTISVTMLVSCQFKYGLLVVGSESMTGKLNVGDAIIYEKYDSQVIETGDILVFEKDDRLIIHRVIEIKVIDGVISYITKGDANENADVGYVIKEQITGISRVRIPFIGYPSVFIRKLF